jgi:hypothetical protein
MKKIIFVLTVFLLLVLALESQAQIRHKIGESYGGGIIFSLTAGGKHGLIAEIQDQPNACFWPQAKKNINDSLYHSLA